MFRLNIQYPSSKYISIRKGKSFLFDAIIHMFLKCSGWFP